MGAKRRRLNTGRKPNDKATLDKFAVKNPVTFPEWLNQARREAAKRREKHEVRD